MAINLQAYTTIKEELDNANATLVAVSKTKPASDIMALYEAGHRDFGENYVQELLVKEAALPKDIRWHFIGHLQSNKVKQIAPFVQLIHGIDSLRLLQEVARQGRKLGRTINCLLQVHIAQEETKFGLDESGVHEILESGAANTEGVNVCGLMGMASFTDDRQKIEMEFSKLKKVYDSTPAFTILSMGMSSDYRIALEMGSNMVRIGSLLFGER